MYNREAFSIQVPYPPSPYSTYNFFPMFDNFIFLTSKFLLDLFIHLLNTYLLSVSHVLGTILSTWDVSLIKTNSHPIVEFTY